MRLSAEVAFWIADERGFAAELDERMIRHHDVLETFAVDDAGIPAGPSGSLSA